MSRSLTSTHQQHPEPLMEVNVGIQNVSQSQKPEALAGIETSGQSSALVCLLSCPYRFSHLAITPIQGLFQKLLQVVLSF
jgi:hypothetical protein